MKEEKITELEEKLKSKTIDGMAVLPKHEHEEHLREIKELRQKKIELEGRIIYE